jgi:transposase
MHVETHDTMDELKEAVRRERDGRVRDRLRAILGAKRGRTAKQVADDLGVSPRAVQDWVRWYNAGGRENLPDAPRSGQPRKCKAEYFEAIKQRVLAGPTPEDRVCTLRGRDVQRILKEQHGVVQSLSATYDLLHTLGLTPLRPRPRHVKNDPEAMKAWEERAPFLSRRSGTPTPARPSRSGSRMRPASASRER